jgi:hypothetical protein
MTLHVFLAGARSLSVSAPRSDSVFTVALLGGVA